MGHAFGSGQQYVLLAWLSQQAREPMCGQALVKGHQKVETGKKASFDAQFGSGEAEMGRSV